jgi:hypothetical protein
VDRAGCESRFGRERRVQIGLKQRREFLELFERQRGPGTANAFGFAHDFSDDLVRLTKRNAPADQIIGGFGRNKSRIGSGLAQPRLMKTRGRRGARGDFSVMSRLDSAACMRPVLPRNNSQASGFFFCGIKLLPVENSSDSSRNPNSCEANRTKSSASREMCVAATASA